MKTSTFYFPGLTHEPVQENKKVDDFIFPPRERPKVGATRTLGLKAQNRQGTRRQKDCWTPSGQVDTGLSNERASRNTIDRKSFDKKLKHLLQRMSSGMK